MVITDPFLKAYLECKEDYHDDISQVGLRARRIMAAAQGKTLSKFIPLIEKPEEVFGTMAMMGFITAALLTVMNGGKK